MFEDLARAVRAIPRGAVSTYGAVARAAGHPGSARQVAWALRVTHDLPWHRVVGAGGAIRLRDHAAIEQRQRLEREGVTFRGGRVDLARHEHDFARPACRRRTDAR